MTQLEITVTAEHRRAALAALGKYQADPTDVHDASVYREQLTWLDEGGTHDVGDHDFVDAEPVALALARAEAGAPLRVALEALEVALRTEARLRSHNGSTFGIGVVRGLLEAADCVNALRTRHAG